MPVLPEDTTYSTVYRLKMSSVMGALSNTRFMYWAIINKLLPLGVARHLYLGAGLWREDIYIRKRGVEKFVSIHL